MSFGRICSGIFPFLTGINPKPGAASQFLPMQIPTKSWVLAPLEKVRVIKIMVAENTWLSNLHMWVGIDLVCGQATYIISAHTFTMISTPNEHSSHTKQVQKVNK
jgi:hypothetical protein